MTVLHEGTDYVVSPGEILEDFLQARGIELRDFARMTSISFSDLNQLIQGKIAIDIDVANAFARHLETDATMWMNLEAQFQKKLTVARRSSSPNMK
jgi:HTH-type transcriptional regulator / antitoxin HigA